MSASVGRPMSGRPATRTVLAALSVCACLAAPAQAETSTSPLPSTSPTIAPAPQTFAAITPTFSPDRLGAHGDLTLTIHFTGGALGVPTPLRRAVLRLPAGLTLEIPSLRSCSTAHLEARGARGCPRQSEIGSGRALVEAYLGAQPITETATLRAFLGPLNNLQPTFEILGQGYSPIGQQMVLTAAALPDRLPYGEQLVMSIPPIPTVPPEPDASISSFSLTIGSDDRHPTREENTVLIPSGCPAGGFPFAAEFTYADGSTGSALATAPCPVPVPVPVPVPSAHVARTVSLNETGHLHLTSKHNYTLNEQGTASGTAPGSIYVHLTAVSTSRVTAEINIYPHGGSLTGTGTASYHRMGSTAGFSGSMSIVRGTGSYAHAHGSGLSFSGTIAESSNDAIAVHVSGRVSD
jgi:hypothetical protein